MDTKLLDASSEFAIRIIQVCDKIKEHTALINRVEDCGISIGAIIHNASTQKNVDEVILSLETALKECRMMKYFINILFKTDIISRVVFSNLDYECDSIEKMITSSINEAKEDRGRSIIK